MIKLRYLIPILAIAGVAAVKMGSALGSYTYTVLRGDKTFVAPSYSTIISANDPLRNMPNVIYDGTCNGGFSPMPSYCSPPIERPPINSVPEPATYLLYSLGLVGLAAVRRLRKTSDNF